jgi:hypothetical protein
MSAQYQPESWVIIQISRTNVNDIHKVLGSYHCDCAETYCWKLSSDITKIVEHDEYYEIYDSESVFNCEKYSEKLTGLTSEILSNMQENAGKQGVLIHAIDIRDVIVLNMFKKCLQS